jgi:hypothetical protein
MKKFLVLATFVILAGCLKNKFTGKVAISGQVEALNTGQAASVFILRNPNQPLGGLQKNITFLERILQTNSTGNYSDSVVSTNDHFRVIALPADSFFDITKLQEVKYGSEFIANIRLLAAKKITFNLKKTLPSDTITQLVIKRLYQGISGVSSFEMDKQAVYLNRFQKTVSTINADSLLLPLSWGGGTQFFELSYLKNGKVNQKNDTVFVNDFGTRIKQISL